MLAKTVSDFLKTREFVSMGTCNLEGRPNAAPKFILKIESNFIYLVDYALGRSYENLKINPRVSLSFTDTENLKSYQVNGSVELIEHGPAHDKISAELIQRQISLSTDRIIKGVSTGKRHENFEVAIPGKFVIFKVKIEEVVEMHYDGELKREKV
jgi:predicted pyridoxine 5'-phosphate oxidase superfamily flavin-nucleotide-binding protein